MVTDFHSSQHAFCLNVTRMFDIMEFQQARARGRAVVTRNVVPDE